MLWHPRCQRFTCSGLAYRSQSCIELVPQSAQRVGFSLPGVESVQRNAPKRESHGSRRALFFPALNGPIGDSKGHCQSVGRAVLQQRISQQFGKFGRFIRQAVEHGSREKKPPSSAAFVALHKASDEPHQCTTMYIM